MHAEILPEQKEIIEKYFKELPQDAIITKKILADAVRKFVSRFLTGKRQEMDIDENGDLFLFIPYKGELWPKNLTDEMKFDIEIASIQEKFNAKNKIKVKQAVKLYRLLKPEEIANEEANTNNGKNQSNQNNPEQKHLQEVYKKITRKKNKGSRY